MTSKLSAMSTIGRVSELQLLGRVVAAAEIGAGGVAVIDGEAGIGKSNLLDELARRAPGSTVVRGRAWEEGGAPSLWPWREVIEQLGGGVDWSTSADRFETYAHVARVVREASQKGPILILLDDLHAADDDTLALTRYVGRGIHDAPVALVAAGRPTPLPPAVAREAVRVTLAPLAASEIGELVDSAALIPLSPSIREEIVKLAEGVPLVAHELALVGAPATTSGRQLPSRIRDVVIERVDGLSGPVRELLGAASVLGRAFSVSDLAMLIKAPTHEVIEGLAPSVAARIVDEGADSWRFTHQVIREGIYESLPVQRRLQLHAAAAEVAGSTRADRVQERARHLLAAVPIVDPSVAVDSVVKAAAALRRSGNYHLAAESLERAVAVCEDPEVRRELILQHGEALLLGGRVEEAWNAFDEAFSLAQEAGDIPARTRALLGRTAIVPSTAEATALAGFVAKSIPSTSDLADRTRLLARYARLQSVAGVVSEALSASLAAVDAAREIGNSELLCEALSVRHYTLSGPNDLEAARDVSSELGTAAEQSGDVEWRFEAEMAQLIDSLRAGDVTEVDKRLARCHEIAGASGQPRHWFFLESRRAMRAFLAGRLAEGAANLDRALRIGVDIEEPDTEQVFHGARTMVLAELGGQDVARSDAEEAEALASLIGEPRLLLFAAYLRSSIGEVEEAAQLVDKAVLPDFSDVVRDRSWLMLMAMSSYAIARSADSRRAGVAYDLLAPYAGQVVVNDGAVAFGGVVDHYLGLLAAALGRPLEARAHLDNAIAAYERMSAALFLVRACHDREQVIAQSRATVSIAHPRRAHLEQIRGEWLCGYAAATFHVRHMVGMQHLATLIEAAGGEVHVLQLVTGGGGNLSEVRTELLDSKAKAEYRERIAGLREDVDEAEANCDYERAERLRLELDAIIEHLRTAVGLGGASRTATTDVERARVAVRKAITAAIDRLAEHDPGFAQHLRLHVRTGTYCRYEADPLHPIAWSISRLS